MKERLIEMLVRDLHDPLVETVGTLDAVRTGAMRSDPYIAREFVTIAADSSRRLLWMLDDLLDIARMNEGVPVLHTQEVIVSEIMHEAAAIVAPSAQARGALISPEVETGLPCLRGDQLKLRRMLVNMIGCVVQFTRTGGRVKVEAKRKNSYKVVLCVTGEGERIADYVHSGAPRGFFDYAEKGEAPVPSVSLTLTFCQMIAEAHGGVMRVERPGEAVVKVVVELPLAGAV